MPRRRDEDTPGVGVGPHPEPWPEDPRLDPELLASGDRRNVLDRYRYWTVEAIREDLDRRRHPYHVAIENWRHDPNIGSVVRNANAFLAAAVHVVGERRWNRRGAMMTEVYQHVHHHPTLQDLATWAAGEGRRTGGGGPSAGPAGGAGGEAGEAAGGPTGAGALPVLGVDNAPGAVPLWEADLPRHCVLLFGQEGPGLSAEARALTTTVVAIPQYGSTRSINAGAASAVVMAEWCRRYAGRGMVAPK